MINRIVKLHFQPHFCDQFIALFDVKKSDIASFHGCHEVRLYRDNNNPNIFFTHSIWESSFDLEFYRQSDIFGKTWTQVKKWFDKKPKAWSTTQIDYSSSNES